MHVPRAIATAIAVAGLTIAGAGTAAAAGPAHGSCTDANERFCAFDSPGYSGELTNFKPVAGHVYSVASNSTESVANHHGSLAVCGVEAEGWPDHTVLVVGAGQFMSTLGAAANDTIEHFYAC